jgi:hypothetical protein
LIEIKEMPADARGYVKKPIAIKAVQIFEPFSVVTLEGKMEGKPGDYLIEGIRGELYPCDREIFLDSYDLVTTGGFVLGTDWVGDPPDGWEDLKEKPPKGIAKGSGLGTW